MGVSILNNPQVLNNAKENLESNNAAKLKKPKSLPSFLHKKFLRFDKTQPFISITAILAFLGIGIGVMVLIVAMAIMNGMSKEFEKRLFVMTYPLSIYSTTNNIDSSFLEKLESNFPNLKFSPYLYSQAIMMIEGAMNAAIVYGIDPKRESNVNEVFNNAIENGANLNDKFSIIVGTYLINSYFINSDDKITLYFNNFSPNGLFISPISKRFSIGGGFKSGMSSYDLSIIYTNIEALASIKNKQYGMFDGINVFSNKPKEDIEKIKNFLKDNNFKNIIVEGFWNKNQNLMSAMELEKRVLFIVLMLIILMASLNIISSLLMVVMNRRKEIALLLSLGASTKEIKETFFRLGISIGFSGIFFGVVLAFIVMWILGTFPIISLPADVYGTDKLPLNLDIFDFIAAVVGAILIVCLSSFYPAKKASQIDTLNVLRNE